MLFGGAAGGMARAEDVTLQLKWVTQAQFAGYYVAKDKGFYEEEGLDVTIKPGGPDVAPAQVIAGGGADVVIDWMPSALAAREKGSGLARPERSGGQKCVQQRGLADAGISGHEDDLACAAARGKLHVVEACQLLLAADHVGRRGRGSGCGRLRVSGIGERRQRRPGKRRQR